MTPRELVRRRVLGDLDTAVADVVATLRARIPAYDALSPEQVAEVAAIASWGIGRVLDLWVAGEELGPADVQRFRGIGAARALDGRPLPGVLRAYRLAGQSVLDLVTDAGADDLAVADAMALASLWMSTVDTLSEALFEGHTSATDRLGGDRQRALGDLLDDLLDGRRVTLTALADRSRLLGVVVPERPVLLVLATPVPDALAGGDLLRTSRDGRDVLVLAMDHVARAVAAVADDHGRGCLVLAHRVTDLARAHRLATLALDRAPTHAHDGRPVLDDGDAHVVALLAGDPAGDAVELGQRVLGTAADPDHAHLLEGLDAFLAHGSATLAAEALGVHAQTMRYRLGRVRALTGRDPRRPWDRLVLQAARLGTGRPAVTSAARD